MTKRKKNLDFSDQRDILNFRPNINFVEPDQVEEVPIVRPVPVTLNTIKNETNSLIKSYKQIQELSILAQEKIDQRSSTIKIKLDPIVDAHIISAVQRHFGDSKKTEITYDDYKECLDHINQHSMDNFTSRNPSANNDQFKTDFGGMGITGGLARPELQTNVQSIKPIDLKLFQIEMIEELLKQLAPGITILSTKIAIEQIEKIVGL